MSNLGLLGNVFRAWAGGVSKTQFHQKKNKPLCNYVRSEEDVAT